VLKHHEGTATRDVDAKKWYFTGAESCLSGLQLAEYFEKMAFQHWKKIVSASGDNCRARAFITMGPNLNMQNFGSIGCIEAVLSPKNNQWAQLPLILQSRFAVVTLFTSSTTSEDYSMLVYTATGRLQVIDIKVMSFHVYECTTQESSSKAEGPAPQHEGVRRCGQGRVRVRGCGVRGRGCGQGQALGHKTSSRGEEPVLQIRGGRRCWQGRGQGQGARRDQTCEPDDSSENC
jgi:hypothetical protein